MAVPKGVRIGGRQVGTLNKATALVKVMAAKHGPAAIAALAKLMADADSDAAKIAAAKELLDRAYGKSTQPIAGDDDLPAIRHALTIAFRGPAG